MSKKQTVNLMVKGEIDINGLTVKHIEGGFGENQKCMSINDIAKVHNQPTREITRRVNDNIKRFKEGVDFIDLKGVVESHTLEEMGYHKSAISQTTNIYILSERGYSKLIKLLTDDKSWEAYDTLLDNYFHLRQENKALKKYSRSNNRFTTKCLFKLDGKKETETDFIFLVNNSVRNEVERVIEEVGVKAGVISVNAAISEGVMSNWRCRRTNLSLEDLEKITNVIVKFKDFVE